MQEVKTKRSRNGQESLGPGEVELTKKVMDCSCSCSGSNADVDAAADLAMEADVPSCGCSCGSNVNLDSVLDFTADGP